MPRQEVVPIPFLQGDGEEVGAAGQPHAPIVHVRIMSSDCLFGKQILIRANAWLGGVFQPESLLPATHNAPPALPVARCAGWGGEVVAGLPGLDGGCESEHLG